MITPKSLSPGDTIAIVAPAGRTKEKIIQPGIELIKSWGLKVTQGQFLFDSHYHYASTDNRRASDFQEALDDPTVKAILCARGGYGSIRILDRLRFDHFLKHPKWIIGFSDITVLHAHINELLGIETIHASMASGIVSSEKAFESLKNTLFGKPLQYEFESLNESRKGSGSGLLTGGNLAVINSLSGSISEIDTDGKVLFIEEVGEHLYRLDRMMWSLKRSGKLAGLAGLIVGSINEIPKGPDFGKTAHEIILEAAGDFDYPICFGFQAGHIQNNNPLIMGRKVYLDVRRNSKIVFENK